MKASRHSSSVHPWRLARMRTCVPTFGLCSQAPLVRRCGNQYPEHQQGRGRSHFFTPLSHLSQSGISIAASMRDFAIWKYPSSSSIPMNPRPVFMQATPVVPEPIVLSRTTSPGLV